MVFQCGYFPEVCVFFSWGLGFTLKVMILASVVRKDGKNVNKWMDIYIYMYTLEVQRLKNRLSPKTISLVGNFNHPKLGTII